MNRTFDASVLARPDLKDFIPYDAPNYPDVIKLDANENPYGFPPEVLVKVYRAASSLDISRYPDPGATILRERLADYTGVNQDNIMVGNGSDEIILNLMLAFGSGAKFAVAAPTFSMYGEHARIAGCAKIEVPRGSDFEIDMAGLKKAASLPEVKMLIICSPNSPTGNVTSPASIESIIGDSNKIIVVDEAYQEFGGESCVPLLGRYPNLVILRTFSKAFGLAGLRVGYLLAGRPVINELLKVKQPYNLNVFSQTAASVVMENLPVFRSRVARILKEREVLFAKLAALPGVKAFASQANFIMFQTPLPAEKVYHGLLTRGILVRNVESISLPRCLRVTVGTAVENKAFIKQLDDVLSCAA